MKRVKRIWSEARAKAEAEGCRVHGRTGELCQGPLETAHVVGRRFDREVSPGVLFVDHEDVIGLCKSAHLAYDAGQLDLLPYLTYREQAAAVKHVGLERARNRLCPSVARAVDDLAAAASEAAELGGAA